MEHYVTLFDSLFLPQGLALHQSLQRHAGAYKLWVLCMDDTAYQVLKLLDLPNVALIALSDAETPELLNVKPSRSRGEYCWTLTPFTPALVFARDSSAQRVTYLDADTWFTANPAAVFADFDASGKSVLITEHAYAPEHDQTAVSGIFCVQFVTFRRDQGEPVRSWWAERCLEWCYARPDNGRFGDQKYLDDWPQRFASLVHVSSNRAWFQAPWNVTRFPPPDARLFHFHSLRTLRNNRIQIASAAYDIPRQSLQTIYQPYLRDLETGLEKLNKAGVSVGPQLDQSIWRIRVSAWVRRLLRWGRMAAMPRPH